jgi:hypothetical protein
MKKMKTILALMLILISGTITYAQKSFLDSIRVQIDNKIELELEVNDYTDLAEIIEKDLKNLQSILKESNEIPSEISYTITYTPDKSVFIKQTDQNERIIWEDGKTTLTQFNNQCIVKSENYFLLVRFNDVESLISDDLIAKIKEVVNTTNTIQNRYAVTYNYAYEGDKLIHNEDLDKKSGESDAIIVKGGVGANLIKNQPVIDLSAEMGLLFNKKGIWKHNYYLSYNQLSFFDVDSRVVLNGFANIGYRYNFSNDINNPNWIGVEVGYLVNRHGDMFDKNTFRVAANWEIGRYITVSPQLYFSGSSSYPALRIGFGF